MSNRLFRNVGSVTVAGALGGASSGIFWLIAARRFTIEEIGIAGGVASLAAAVNVLTSLGFIGASVHNSSTRFGNGGLLVIGTLGSSLLSVLGSGLVVLFVLVTSSGSHYLLAPSTLMLALSLISGAAAVGGITDVVGGPLGNAWLAPARGVLLGAFRIFLVLTVTKKSGALGLDLAFAIPMAVSSILSTIYLATEMKFREHRFWPDREQLAAYWHFSLHSLPSTMVMSILPAAPPAIAVWLLGARSGGVFYITWNGFVLANLLVASATVLGISPEVNRDHLVKVVRRIAGSCSALMFLGGPPFLLLYGHEYFRDGWIAISLLGLSLFPYSQEQLQVTLLRRLGKHHQTTRITIVLGISGLLGLVLGAATNRVWGMAGGWLIAVTGLLAIGTRFGSFLRSAEWLPAMPSQRSALDL